MKFLRSSNACLNFAISQPGWHGVGYTTLPVSSMFELNLSACAWTSQIPHTSLYKQRGEEEWRSGSRGEAERERQGEKALIRRSCWKTNDRSCSVECVCVRVETLSFTAINIRPVAIYTHLNPRHALCRPSPTTPDGNQAATRNHLSYHQR